MVLETSCGKKETEVGDIIKDKLIIFLHFKNRRVEKGHQKT